MTSIGRGSTTDEVVAALGCDASTLAGRTVLITGATAGIGRATALCLASLGPTLVCGCRSDEKGKALIDGLNAELPSPPCVFVRHLELSDLDSVQSFAAEVGSRLVSGEWPPLHSLVLNAGVINLSATFGADGMESTFRTNHLGHFLLAQLMLPYLRSAAPARVIVVASASHFGPLATAKRGLDDEGVWIEDVVYPSPETWSMSRGNAAYGSSKLANVLFASELYRREASMNTGVVACSLHPGNMMATDIGRDNWFVNALMKAGGLFGITRSMAQGAATTVFCTLADHWLLRGQYWSDCAEADASWRAKGEVGAAAATTLWSLSERLVAASNAAGRRDAVVLPRKAGAWRPVADGEQFGPGHSFSMNLTTGARYVSIPANKSTIDHCRVVMTQQSLGPEALVAEFVEDRKQTARTIDDHGGADSRKARL